MAIAPDIIDFMDASSRRKTEAPACAADDPPSRTLNGSIGIFVPLSTQYFSGYPGEA